MTQRMTRTQAAEGVGQYMRVRLRQTGKTPTREMAEEIVSEMRAGHLGGYYRECAVLANPKTVLRVVNAELRRDW